MMTREMTLRILKKVLKRKRQELNNLLSQKNIVVTDEILKVSREMDILIVAYYEKLNSSRI
ncbi:Spo0E family sporulation regulatory protein-aspartic acid phosphatase [Clostridium chromiireducens]|uniref:Spo0E family sporulation regulatory protein-aspartic acid phosphatase n=1 Tax=Clostridium chromiireducens TaxID=225345 RepID=UPI003AF5AF79